MSHEITKTDNVLLVKDAAWHGLGVVVPEAVKPTESLDIIGADWGVQQLKLKGIDDNGKEYEFGEHFINVRSDTKELLGIVSEHYKVFNNIEVAEFCEQLAEQSDTSETPVRVETAGTIRGGKKVWFLLKGDTFEVANSDAMVPYVLVSNGHDGITGLSVTPTTIRVVCSNTLHMVIPDGARGSGYSKAAISIEHMGNLKEKVRAAREAIKSYDMARGQTIQQIEQMARKEVSTKALAEYFATLYNADFAPAEPDASDRVGQLRLERGRKGWKLFKERFAKDETLAGASWWNAFNAYSGYIQHDKVANYKKVPNSMFGIKAAQTQKAFVHALNASTSV